MDKAPSAKCSNAFHLRYAFKATRFHVTVDSTDHILICMCGSQALLYV